MLDKLSGSVIIAQTPFDDRGAVDLASIDTLTDFYLKHGADGFVVLGMSGDTPVVLQDFPQSTGVWMSVPSILRLIEAFPQIKVVKEEDLPSLEKITQLRAKHGRRVSIMTGNNGLYLPYEMARGVDGPMAGFSHPEMLSGVYRLFVKGDAEAAHDLFDRYLPLLDYEAQGFWGVAARKEVMRRRGAIHYATMRRPGPSLFSTHMAEIDLLLRRLSRALAERI
jgi:4-hydroxy-tetrahydrodipicolinate synthase